MNTEQPKGEGTTSAISAKKLKRRQIAECIAHIRASFNNTQITLSNPQGDVFAWSSSAKAGFRGSRKGTPYAGQVAVENLVWDSIEKFGVKQAHVKVEGPGPGRESALRALGSKIKILSISDVTKLPHNGCRDRKKRRA